ncbi:hypothetical protein AAMO2058_000729400 [Amorphochlora amoebiformis]
MASRAGRARRRARVQRCLPLAAILFLATALSAVPSRSCVPSQDPQSLRSSPMSLPESDTPSSTGPPPARPPSEIRFRDRFGEKFGPLLEQREAKKQMIKEKEREKYIKIPLDIPVQNITEIDKEKEPVFYLAQDGSKKKSTVAEIGNVTDIYIEEGIEEGTRVQMYANDLFGKGNEKIILGPQDQEQFRLGQGGFRLDQGGIRRKDANSLSDEEMGTIEEKAEKLRMRINAFVPVEDAPDKFEKRRNFNFMKGTRKGKDDQGNPVYDVVTPESYLKKKQKSFFPKISAREFSLYTGLATGLYWWIQTTYKNYIEARTSTRFQEALSAGVAHNITLSDFLGSTTAKFPQSDRPISFLHDAWRKKGGTFTRGESLEINLQMMPVFSSAVSLDAIEVLVWRRMGGIFSPEEMMAIDQATIQASRDFEQINTDLRQRAKLLISEGGTFTDFVAATRQKTYLSRDVKSVANLFGIWTKGGGSLSRMETVNTELSNLKEHMRMAIDRGVTFTEFIKATCPEDIIKDKQGKETLAIRISRNCLEVVMWKNLHGGFTAFEKKAIIKNPSRLWLHRWMKFINPNSVKEKAEQHKQKRTGKTKIPLLSSKNRKGQGVSQTSRHKFHGNYQ